MWDYLHQHRLLTALIVVWLLGLVTYPTLRVFSDTPPDIPGGTATALGMVYGLPAIAVGLWKWRGGLLGHKPVSDD